MSYVRVRYYTRLLFNHGWGEAPVTLYTGIVVRRLLAACSPTAAEMLSARMTRPKPVTLTPLYRGAKPLYPRLRRGTVEYPMVRHGDVLWFEVATAPGYQRIHEELTTCLEEGILLEAFGHTLRVTLTARRTLIRYEPGINPLVDTRRASRVTLELRTPTLPTNPWKPRSRWKRLLPAPSYILHTNILEATGGDTQRAERLAEEVEKALEPTPETSVEIEWPLLPEKPQPTLKGRIVYAIAPDANHNLLSHILTLAATMGTGAARATGLGHTTINPTTKIG